MLNNVSSTTRTKAAVKVDNGFAFTALSGFACGVGGVPVPVRSKFWQAPVRYCGGRLSWFSPRTSLIVSSGLPSPVTYQL